DPQSLERRVAVARRTEDAAAPAGACFRRLPREGLRKLPAVLCDAGPSARRHAVHLRTTPARSIEVRVCNSVLIEVLPEAIHVPRRARIPAKRMAGPPGESDAAFEP